MARSHSCCELCGADNGLSVHEVHPASDGSAEQAVLLCETCHQQITDPATTDANHWRCLNDSMWSQVPAVQVLAWRQLKHLSAESWAQDLLAMLYLDDDILAWAQASNNDGTDSSSSSNSNTLDSNGAVLNAGDTVTLIKDLDVKGAGFTAKRGTAVRNISLTDKPEQIEGRVNGVRIVLLSKFLKKSS